MILCRMQRKYLFQLCLILSIIPDSQSQRNEICSQAFQCGSIGNIRYPFWGSSRPEICGFPGFELLNCQGDDNPLLNIDSRSYRVLEIDFVTQSLRLARLDLWNNTCPRVLRNTTLDPTLFEPLSTDSYENVTLYYNCTGYQTMNLNNQFTCDRTLRYSQINHFPVRTVNLFAPGEPSQRGSNITCSNNISVPVNLSAARVLSSPSASTNNLRDALASGFWVQWLDKITTCEGCVKSGGVCGYESSDPSSLSNIKCNATSIMVVIAGPTSASPGAGTVVLKPTPRESPPMSIITLVPKASPSLVLVEGPGPFPFYYPDTRDGTSGLSTLGKLLIGMAIGVAAIVSATFIIVYLRRLQNGSNEETNSDVENFLLNNEYLAPKRYKYSQLKRVTKSFSDKLGQGGYGSVYKGMLPNGQTVAVKLLTETKSNGEDFINEVASISKTSHVNIVSLLGFCYERNRSALIYEFMPNKSLDKFISTNRSLNTDCQLDSETLFKIAVGVARGLEYLHKGCNTRIVHFDIKPQNILLDEEFCPKISDFGLAKLCKKKQSVLSIAGTRGTIGYIAPEVFSRNFGEVSHKSDVYSYGMMVLEMAGARYTTGMGSIQSSENYFPDKI